MVWKLQDHKTEPQMNYMCVYIYIYMNFVDCGLQHSRAAPRLHK